MRPLHSSGACRRTCSGCSAQAGLGKWGPLLRGPHQSGQSCRSLPTRGELQTRPLAGAAGTSPLSRLLPLGASEWRALCSGPLMPRSGACRSHRGVRGSAPTLWIFPEKVLVRGRVVRPGPLVCFPHSLLRVPSRGRDVGTGFGGPGSCLHVRGSRGHGIPVSRSVVTTALMSAACSFPPFVPLPRPTCPAAPCLQPLPPGVTTCEKPWLGGLRLPDPQPPR